LRIGKPIYGPSVISLLGSLSDFSGRRHVCGKSKGKVHFKKITALRAVCTTFAPRWMKPKTFLFYWSPCRLK